MKSMKIIFQKLNTLKDEVKQFILIRMIRLYLH